jgi:hypothetical protein
MSFSNAFDTSFDVPEVQIGTRFGWDAPARIATTSEIYDAEGAVMLPSQPFYPTVLPFVVGGVPATGISSSDVSTWESEPSRLDLHYYQGDDISIPLIFRDPDVPIFDMSDQANWDWFAHVRTGQGRRYLLLYEFTCSAEYVPPVPPETLGTTKVTLVLPRDLNKYRGDFWWDLQSWSPSPTPPIPPEEDSGVVHTWLWGKVEVTGDVTYRPEDVPPPPVYEGTDVFLAITTGTGRTVGPTGEIG